MKKILLSLALLFVTSFAHAEINFKEIVDKFPPAKTGVGYSFVENNLNFLTVFEVYRVGNFSLNGGYAGAQPNTGHKLVGTVLYDLYNNRESENPILNKIDLSVGAWFGAGNIENIDMRKAESDWGISVTALKFRFW